MNRQVIEWTFENKQTLARMWGEGRSAADIALAISGSSRNRNAILGKAHRMQLGPHTSGKGHPRLTAKQREERDLRRSIASAKRVREKKALERIKEAEEMAKMPPTMIVPKIEPRLVVDDGVPLEADFRFQKGRAWEPLPGSLPVSLVDLKPRGQCRWPLGESPFTFCAQATQDGTSYCASHNHLSIRRL